MLGIVLVMHAPLASAMRDCIQHIMGNLPIGVLSVDIPADTSIEACVELIQQAVSSADQGKGVFLLTDLFGATPSNAAVRASLEHNGVSTVLVSGCNLPMVIRALSYRELELDEVAEKLVMGGRNGIVSTGLASEK